MTSETLSTLRRAFMLLLPLTIARKLSAQKTKVGEDQQESRQPNTFPAIWLRGAKPNGNVPVTIDQGTMTLDPITNVLAAKIPQGGSGPVFVDWETPTGNLPGSLFSLNAAPNPPSSLMLVINGAVQDPGPANDYTLTGNQIATATNGVPVVWPAGTKIRANYRK